MSKPAASPDPCPSGCIRTAAVLEIIKARLAEAQQAREAAADRRDWGGVSDAMSQIIALMDVEIEVLKREGR